MVIEVPGSAVVVGGGGAVEVVGGGTTPCHSISSEGSIAASGIPNGSARPSGQKAWPRRCINRATRTTARPHHCPEGA